MKRIKAVIIKEFLHILRDPTSLTIVFLMPVIMILIFGYSINFDLKSIDVGIIDYSDGEISNQLIKKFANNQYFIVKNLRNRTGDPLIEGEKLIKSGDLKEIIIIPRDFSKKIKNNQKSEVGIILDGSDANVANLIYQYNDLVIMDFISDFIDLKQFIKISTKVYFNPEVKSTYFFIPGLIAIILLMISALLTSLSISKEKELGSINLIFISPLKSTEIIIGKTIPYIIVALIDELIILLYAVFWFGVPFRGNLLVLLIFSLLYIFTGLSLGILISTVAPSQKVAMFATLLITLLPSIMLSGFIFPLDSLSPILRGVSQFIPATYFLKIIRGVVVKGAELKHFLFEGIALITFSILLISIASLKFNRLKERSR